MNRLGVVCSILLSIVLTACGGGSGGSSPTPAPSPSPSPSPSPTSSNFDFGAMFTNLADNVIIPNYEAFKDSSEAFAGASGELAAYCSAIGLVEEASALEAAQTEWRALMVQWQRAEVHNLGPAADEANLLRNQIYADAETSVFDSCRTDRAVVLAEESGFDISTRVFTTRGLDALEYLLFEETLEHTCTTSNPQTDPWNARSELERKQARCGYAQEAANDISSAAATLHNAWISSGGNYRETFIGSTSTHELILESVSDAIFYVEQYTKDFKLGVPLGFNDGCTETACPADVESPFSNHALQNIRANVEAFSSIYHGGSGLSFDDIISNAGMASINTDFDADAQAIFTLVDAMIGVDENIADQAQTMLTSGNRDACESSANNPDIDQTVTACALYGLLKRQNDRLRTDFVTVVGVDLPDRVQGDTD